MVRPVAGKANDAMSGPETSAPAGTQAGTGTQRKKPGTGPVPDTDPGAGPGLEERRRQALEQGRANRAAVMRLWNGNRQADPGAGSR